MFSCPLKALYFAISASRVRLKVEVLFLSSVQSCISEPPLGNKTVLSPFSFIGRLHEKSTIMLLIFLLVAALTHYRLSHL